MPEEFLSFKKDAAYNLLQKLFYIGVLPLFLPAFFIGRYFAILFPADIQVPANEPGLYTFRSEPNILIGTIVGVFLLIVSIAIWKIICQILLIMLEAFEAYISRNNLD